MNPLKIVVLLLLLANEAIAEEYVSCPLWGQLGNQLFEITTVLALAWDNDAQAVFPDLETETIRNIPLNRKKIFFRLHAQLPEHIKLKDYFLTFDYAPIEYEPNLNLKGFSISLKHFDRYRARIQKLFEPSQQMKEYLYQKYPEVLHHTCSVGIQIRASAHKILPFSGWKYFEEAMDLFPKDALFIVCSARPQWAKKHFPINERNVIFIEGNDHITDFFLLTLCKHNIISASTYGYWAAYLNQYPNKQIVAPSLWFPHTDRRTKQGFPYKWGVYPQEWTILNVPFIRKVPKDLKFYATSSVEGG